jgi:hypothetical protein
VRTSLAESRNLCRSLPKKIAETPTNTPFRNKNLNNRAPYRATPGIAPGRAKPRHAPPVWHTPPGHGTAIAPRLVCSTPDRVQRFGKGRPFRHPWVDRPFGNIAKIMNVWTRTSASSRSS